MKNKIPNIYIWKNTETLQELVAMLKNKAIHLEKITNFKSDGRIKQYLITRLLVQTIIGDFKLKKGKNNKPYIEGYPLEVSFSHNKEFTILMTSQVSCGIDVQVPTEKAIKVKSKFINKNDFCSQSLDLETLSKVWSCKEAAFKKFGNHEIYLKENISVIKQISNTIFEVLVTFKNKQHALLVKQESIENNYLFFTLN